MSDRTPKAKEYAKVVEDAVLENIRLVASNFNVSASFRDDDPTTEGHIDQSITGPDFDRESNLLIGIVDCRCWFDSPTNPVESGDGESSDAKSGDKDPLFSIVAKYVLAFKIRAEHDDEMLGKFFSRVAPMSVWPYFRAHVATTAAQGNVDIPVLPIKKLIHRVEASKDFVDPDEPQRLR